MASRYRNAASPLRGDITRRDFINGVLVAGGAALIGANRQSIAADASSVRPAADWYGYGGVGDYAPSHGNTPDVVYEAHRIRDHGSRILQGRDIVDTEETYDLIVIGCGIAGLGAALEFSKTAGAGRSCLMLDNHPLFGGEAKRNEFIVRGERLLAPQGANGFFTPPPTDPSRAIADARWYDQLGVPRAFTYSTLDADDAVRVPNDNFGFMYWMEHSASIGYSYRATTPSGKRLMVRDQWIHALDGTPFTAIQKQELLNWRSSLERGYQGEDFGPWLDSMSYRDYIQNVMKLGEHVTAYADPVLASTFGLGCDAVSAYAAYTATLPGVQAFAAPADRDFRHLVRNSFPGGNDGFSRYFVKRLIPSAITGPDTFEGIINGNIDFNALDRDDAPVRMRLAATIVSVEHEREDSVSVVYSREGQLHRVRARGVVAGIGSWIAKHVIRETSAERREACDHFVHAPFLIANLALNNWRFMYDAGVSACRYEGDFGFSCNIRQPMIVGDMRTPLHPDKPAVLTFYVPFHAPGLDPKAQGAAGRARLFSSSYADIEQRLLRQLRDIFGGAFVPTRDVAGLILNRWGHAYSVPVPGFYFGRGGKRPWRDVIREPMGRIGFAHSELHGLQHWGNAADEGRRAVHQVLEAIG